MTGGWQTARLRQTPSWLLMQTATLTKRFAASAFSSVEATRHQYTVLCALDDQVSATQAELGRYCQMDRSDIAVTVGELEAGGHVERRANPADRRQKVVSLTDEGHRRLDEIARALYDAQDELLADMGREDRETLSRLLVEVLEAHSAAPPADGAGTSRDAAAGAGRRDHVE